MNIKSKSTLKKLENILRFRNYSEQTIKTYVSYCEKFLMSFDKDVYHISVKEAKNYLENYAYTSISQQNQIISSIKFLYTNVVGSKLNTLKITRPRKEKKLPKVIDSEYLKETILSIDNLKHRAILSLGYSCALRVSEVINLKIEHIDSKRMIIHIVDAKGRKDRIVRLSPILLQTLREYVKKYRPNTFLFNGQFSLQYSASSCNKLVKNYLGESYHFHLLRHSGLTNMHENNVDIATLSKIAGHNSIKTTMIYTHVSNMVIQNSHSPI